MKGRKRRRLDGGDGGMGEFGKYGCESLSNFCFEFHSENRNSLLTFTMIHTTVFSILCDGDYPRKQLAIH